jgi:hypothetical protein
MDHNQIFIIFLFVAFVILSIGVVAVLFLRKKLFIVYQNETEENIKQKITKILQEKNYNFKVKGKKIHIESSRFKALNLYFKQTENEVKVFREVSESPSGAIYILIGVFLFGIVALILSQLSDVKSRELANELHPILQVLK